MDLAGDGERKTAAAFLQLPSLCQRRAIFPGRRQPSIVATDELNFRVRNGNGWTLIVIGTDFGDPCGNRTHVWGVRGPRLNLLTNGPSSARASLASFPRFAQEPGNLAGVRPYLLFKSKQPFRFETRGVLQWKNGTPSGTRTLDTLIKSQVLYQLS